MNGPGSRQGRDSAADAGSAGICGGSAVRTWRWGDGGGAEVGTSSCFLGYHWPMAAFRSPLPVIETPLPGLPRPQLVIARLSEAGQRLVEALAGCRCGRRCSRARRAWGNFAPADVLEEAPATLNLTPYSPSRTPSHREHQPGFIPRRLLSHPNTPLLRTLEIRRIRRTLATHLTMSTYLRANARVVEAAKVSVARQPASSGSPCPSIAASDSSSSSPAWAASPPPP